MVGPQSHVRRTVAPADSPARRVSSWTVRPQYVCLDYVRAFDVTRLRRAGGDTRSCSQPLPRLSASRSGRSLAHQPIPGWLPRPPLPRRVHSLRARLKSEAEDVKAIQEWVCRTPLCHGRRARSPGREGGVCRPLCSPHRGPLRCQQVARGVRCPRRRYTDLDAFTIMDPTTGEFRCEECREPLQMDLGGGCAMREKPFGGPEARPAFGSIPESCG